MIPIRDDNPRFYFPIMTVGLIAVNALVFIVELSQGPRLEDFIWTYGYVPAEFVHSREELREEMEAAAPEKVVMDRYGRVRVDFWGNPITRRAALPYEKVIAVPAWINIFTCMFLHGGWGHLLGNMLYLWIFGSSIEQRLGGAAYLVFYVVTGLAGNLLHTAFDPSVMPLVGASGAISGVMGGYILLYPRARIYALVPAGWYWFTARLPGWIFLGIYFFLQNLFPALGGVVSGRQGSNVAFLAHIGGFLAGLVLVYFFPKRKLPYYARPAAAYADDDDADVVI